MEAYIRDFCCTDALYIIHCTPIVKHKMLVSRLRGRSKEKPVYTSHVAQVGDTAQVTSTGFIVRIN